MKVSIITINYNNADGLVKTINSVLQQTYANLQYVVIDGNSTDASKSILNQYNDRIDFCISEPDSGIYQAMNKGIKAAEGDYFLFLNSGDILVSNTVIAEVVGAGLTADLISANMRFIEPNFSYIWTPPEFISFSLFYNSTLPHPSTFIKKELFNLVGLYDEALNIVSDWKFFFIAACKYNCSYRHTNILLSEYIGDGISSDPKNRSKIEEERKVVLTEDFGYFLNEYEELESARLQLRSLRSIIKIRRFFGVKSLA